MRWGDANGVGGVVDDLGYAWRAGERRWGDMSSYWNDKQSATFEAEYWQPFQKACQDYRQAVEELDQTVAAILSRLP